MKQTVIIEWLSITTLVRGMVTGSATCEKFCEDVDHNAWLKGFDLQYLRCYKYENGNNEDAANLASSGTSSVNCTGVEMSIDANLF